MFEKGNAQVLKGQTDNMAVQTNLYFTVCG